MEIKDIDDFVVFFTVTQFKWKLNIKLIKYLCLFNVNIREW